VGALELSARVAVALFGAFVLVVLAQTVQGAARSIQGILSRTSPEPESWALVRVFHARALRTKEVLTGLVALIVLLLLRPEATVKVVLYGWAAVMLVGGLDYALRRLWRWRSRPD
jgi:hypothetical protein